MSEFKVGDEVEWNWSSPATHEKGVIISIKNNDARIRRTWSAMKIGADCTIGTLFNFMRKVEAGQSASWLPKVGERVRVKESCIHSELRGKCSVAGNVHDNYVRIRFECFAELWMQMWDVLISDLEPAPIQAAAFTDDGAKERRESRVAKWPDPYAVHTESIMAGPRAAAYAGFVRDQDAKHASMLAQAKAELDRPVRTGALKNRDRYGQKISLHVWTTDESEP